MAEIVKWRIAMEANESRQSKRIAHKQSSSHDQMRVRVDFRCEIVQKWMHHCVVGQERYIRTESRQEPRIKTRTTFFDYTLPARDLKKLVLEKLEFFDLSSPNRKGRLANEVIRHAQNLIGNEKERSFSLVVNIHKETVFYFKNIVTQEISNVCEDNHGGPELECCTVCLDDIAKGDKVSTLPCCHVFHSDCILDWLKRSRSCPICRFEIPKPKRRRIHH